MPPGIGYSFQPGAQDTQLQQRGQEGQGSAPQQAIRTLSLRVPQTNSVPGIAPLSLLNAKGGGGTDLDMLLTALLKAFGGGSMPGAGGYMPGGGTPAPPRVKPTDPTDPMGRSMPEQNGPPQIPQDFPPRGEPKMPTPIPSPDIPRDFPPTDGTPQPLPMPDGPLEQQGQYFGRKAFPRMVQPLF